MRKKYLHLIFTLIFITLVHVSAIGQSYHQISHTNGAQSVAFNFITVNPRGSVNAVVPWNYYCGITSYWIGIAGVGSYQFSFSQPVKAIRLNAFPLRTRTCYNS